MFPALVDQDKGLSVGIIYIYTGCASLQQLAQRPWSSQVLTPGHTSPWGHSPSPVAGRDPLHGHTRTVNPFIDTRGHPVAGLQILSSPAALCRDRQTYKLVSVEPRPRSFLSCWLGPCSPSSSQTVTIRPLQYLTKTYGHFDTWLPSLSPYSPASPAR